MKSCNSYRHVIQCNLKGPGADKLGLNGCGREGYKKDMKNYKGSYH